MKRRNEPVVPVPEEKVLDVNASMQGTLRFDDPVNLRINGKFEGTLDIKGRLMVGDRAEVKANITGETISVSGTITGNVKATTLLKLESTARVTGDVETPRISISEGAFISGNIHMPGFMVNSSGTRGDWMNMTQLAKYLEVDSIKINEWATNGLLPGTKEGGEWVFERAKVDQWISEGKVKV
ncbi:MAG TPA: polymer-forming cytoskeletal protein [Candidatus Omnitrophota bacterium]|nr:polymer-forming cytoskeletal protein [Candidatus Omnitrophota bacterium]